MQRKHHRKHKRRHGHGSKGSELVQHDKPSQDEESLAEQKTMDMVKEELENSMNNEKKEESGSDDEDNAKGLKPIGEVIAEKETDEKEKAEDAEKQQYFKEAKDNANK